MTTEPDGVPARRTRMRLAAPPAALLLVLAGCGERGDPEDPAPEPPGLRSSGWARLPDAPLAGRTSAAAVGVGDRVYVFGGWEFMCPPGADCAGPTSPPFADGAVLDLATQEWQPTAEAPFGFTRGSSAVIGDDIYLTAFCADGIEDCYGRPELLRYDTVGDTWAELGTMPKGIGRLLVATDHGLVALSGTYENGREAEAVFDEESATWTPLPDAPLPRTYDRFAIPDGDRLLVFGSPELEAGEEADTKVAASYDFATGEWTALPPAPGPGYQVWRAGDRAFLNPHYGDGGGVLDLETGTWSAFPDGPDDPEWRGDLAGLISTDGATYEYSEGWVMDARDDEWLEVPDRGGEAYDDSRVAVGQALVVFGGQEWAGDEGQLLAETWVWWPPA